MKKHLIITILLLTGCSNKITLNCNYNDKTSIYGSKKINDTITFKNDKPISYKRQINFTINNNMTKKTKQIYKNLKNEGKTFKEYVKGQYTIKKNSNEINLILKAKKIDNLNYININKDDNYENIKETYKEMGFNCK